MFQTLRQKVRRNPAIAGVPLLLLVVGSTVGIATFQGGKYDRWDRVIKSQTEVEYNIEKEYERTMQKMDISNYEPVPIERPK